MSEQILKLKNIKPLGNQIVTEAVRYTNHRTDAGLILPRNFGIEGEIKHVQKVVMVGPTVRNIEVGDYVWINFFTSRYFKLTPEAIKRGSSLAGLDSDARASHVDNEGTIYYPEIMVGGERRLLIYDNDVKYVGEPE